MSKNEETPGPVPQEAVDYFEQKEFKISFDYDEVWKEEHMAAFTVAKAMKTNILDAMYSFIDASIKDGTSADDFKKSLKPKLVKMGWWGVKEVVDPKTGKKVKAQLGSPSRLELIFETNMRVAHACGQWQRIEKNKDITPYLIYGLGPSKVHRDLHVSWNNTILPVDDIFWNTHFVPSGFGCKCTIRAISAREAEERGGVTKRPDMTPVAWKNKRTGEIEYVPIGIQPGWDYNPGKERMKNLDK